MPLPEIEYIKHWSQHPMRSHAEVRIGSRVFTVVATGYKGPTYFFRAWEGGREIEKVASKKASKILEKLQKLVQSDIDARD